MGRDLIRGGDISAERRGLGKLYPLVTGKLKAEFSVSDFIATLNYHSHVEADDYGHSLTPPRQICRT